MTEEDSREAELRSGVKASLPELDLIQDDALRTKVIEAWVFALSRTSFRRIEDIPASGVPGTAVLTHLSQADHLRATARQDGGRA